MANTLRQFYSTTSAPKLRWWVEQWRGQQGAAVASDFFSGPALALPAGVESTAGVGAVTVVVEARTSRVDDTAGGGSFGPRRMRRSRPRQDAAVAVHGVEAVARIGFATVGFAANVVPFMTPTNRAALGHVEIHTGVSLAVGGVVAELVIGAPGVRAVQNPTDEELIALLLEAA